MRTETMKKTIFILIICLSTVAYGMTQNDSGLLSFIGFTHDRHQQVKLAKEVRLVTDRLTSLPGKEADGREEIQRMAAWDWSDEGIKARHGLEFANFVSHKKAQVAERDQEALKEEQKSAKQMAALLQQLLYNGHNNSQRSVVLPQQDSLQLKPNDSRLTFIPKELDFVRNQALVENQALAEKVALCDQEVHEQRYLKLVFGRWLKWAQAELDSLKKDEELTRTELAGQRKESLEHAIQSSDQWWLDPKFDGFFKRDVIAKGKFDINGRSQTKEEQRQEKYNRGLFTEAARLEIDAQAIFKKAQEEVYDTYFKRRLRNGGDINILNHLKGQEHLLSSSLTKGAVDAICSTGESLLYRAYSSSRADTVEATKQ